MAINQLIAQGIAPIGRDVPQVMNMLAQRDIAQRGAAVDEQNAANYQNSLSQQGQARAAAATEATRAKAIEWATNAVGTVRQNPALIPQFIAQGKQQGLLPPETPDQATPEQVEQFAMQLGIGPQAPTEYGQPVAGVGPDGRQAFRQFSKTGDSRPVEGFQPAPPRTGGKGFSLTTADGTTFTMGGDGKPGPAVELGKPMRGRLEEAFTNAQGNALAIAGIMQKWNPEFSRLSGRLAAMTAKGKDFLDIASPEEKQYLADFSSWKGDVSANLSTYLNQLSGAAISPAEETRLRAGMPNDQDSPTEFKSKADATLRRLSLVQARSAYLLSKPEISMDAVSIDQMSRIMLDQANQLAMAYMRGGMSVAEAKAQAMAETRKQFGLQ